MALAPYDGHDSLQSGAARASAEEDQPVSRLSMIMSMIE